MLPWSFGSNKAGTALKAKLVWPYSAIGDSKAVSS